MGPLNPFTAFPSSSPGEGTVHLTLLPPNTPAFSTLAYAYPLKLLPSSWHLLPPERDPPPSKVENPAAIRPTTVPLLFLLSYGGGLLPPDALTLHLKLDPNTRLTLTTQGNTKIFPSPPPHPSAASSGPPPVATQALAATLHAHSGLLLAPDPTQPFRGSHYVQRQTFDVHPGASLGLLDWVSEGRRARGESWEAGSWRGRNEVWRVLPGTVTATASSPRPAPSNGDSGIDPGGERRLLLLRDSVILADGPDGPGQRGLRADGLGVFGTLVLLGPLFAALARFFLSEFAALPRIGARDWGDADADADATDSRPNAAADISSGGVGAGLPDAEEEARARKRRLRAWRKSRWEREERDRVLWTAARVRGAVVVVKFGAAELHGARLWLGDMLKWEGTVDREFGPGGLMCVK